MSTDKPQKKPGGNMKIRCSIIVFLSVSLLFVGLAWAGGFDNRTNWSAEYIRTWNRNATTDSADGVLYNPAGMMKMENGLFGNLSLQYIDNDTKNIIEGVEMGSHKPNYIPSLFALYKKDRWAGMFAFSNFGGGGSVNFENGNWTTQQLGFGYAQVLNFGIGSPVYTSVTNQNVEAQSMYLGYTIGGAYKFNDIFSASLGVRYITADRKAEGSVTVSSTTYPDQTANVEYEQDAQGWGGIIGLNISPNDRWNIGIRYETETPLEFDTSVKQGAALLSVLEVVEDGEKYRRNLPATAALGVAWQTTPKLRLETNLTYYLNDSADWSGFENINDNVGDGYDLGLSGRYTINEKWEASLGVLYTYLGVDPQYMTPENPELDAFTIGGGVGYSPTKKWTINAGIANVFYMAESFTESVTPFGQEIEYKKNNFCLAIGAQYKFF